MTQYQERIVNRMRQACDRVDVVFTASDYVDVRAWRGGDVRTYSIPAAPEIANAWASSDTYR